MEVTSGVTAGVYYAMNDVDYDAGNGTMVYAGYNDLVAGYYVGATYGLGNGAELGASYADFIGIPEDTVGAQSYTNGISIWLSASF